MNSNTFNLNEKNINQNKYSAIFYYRDDLWSDYDNCAARSFEQLNNVLCDLNWSNKKLAEYSYIIGYYLGEALNYNSCSEEEKRILNRGFYKLHIDLDIPTAKKINFDKLYEKIRLTIPIKFEHVTDILFEIIGKTKFNKKEILYFSFVQGYLECSGYYGV